MKEHQILFSGEMVRAILEGRKTQTRRIVMPLPSPHWNPTIGVYNPTIITNGGDEAPGPEIFGASDESEGRRCPYGQPGDRLWVRETFDPIYGQDPPDRVIEIDYKADWVPHGNRWRMKDVIGGRRWTPSIHMPRWACRILLEITAIRVERLQDISEADAWAEGVNPSEVAEIPSSDGATAVFSLHWEKIYGPGSWNVSPWVWVIEFQQVQ